MMIFLIGGGGYVYDNTKLHNGGAVAARTWTNVGRKAIEARPCTQVFIYIYIKDRRIFNNLPCH